MTDKILPRLVLLKLANTCNINCSYCYWFKDLSVYDNSKIITDSVLNAFYKKLSEYIENYKIRSFTVVLHGGEPLLAGKKRVTSILYNLNRIQYEQEMAINIRLQTNGILLDPEWADILQSFNVSIGVSMDGPKEIHDLNRRDLVNKPTYDKTLKGINLLKLRGIKFGILTVYNSAFNAHEICDFYINQLGIKTFDFLIPAATYEDVDIADIGTFYKELLQLYKHKYSKEGVVIKIAKTILDSFNGIPSGMEFIGFGTEEVFMIKPDGEIEAMDYLHSLGNHFTSSHLNIQTNEIIDITGDPLWKEIYESSTNLCEKCLQCKYKNLCGGGHVGSRWSKSNHFNNPSVYCKHLYEIFDYAAGMGNILESERVHS
jgi:uncharacterized protein